MSINIIKAGIATAVQDLGREGYYHLGIPQSGAMDRYAMLIANLLVGNPDNHAGLEITFMGPEILFNVHAKIAVTGGNIAPKINGELHPIWTTLAIKKGDTLSFDFVKSGARAYLAISGGVDVPIVLGSRATYALGALGGHRGRLLKDGDTLPIGTEIKRDVVLGTSVPENLRRQVGNNAEIQVLSGLYWHRLTQQAQQQFFADIWTVGSEVDRIGYRFNGGTPIEFVEREQPFGAGSDPSNIVDSCYPYGSIQIPGGTSPIVLHRDAVSGGGFFTVGCVISSDMDYIGQLQPNRTIQFISVTMDEALESRQRRQTMLNKVRQLINT